MEDRECIKCQSPLVLGKNWLDSAKKYGQYTCRPCAKIDMATRRVKYRDTEYQKAYGITSKQYQMMHDKQKGKCLICDKEETVVRNGKVINLAVDHNHITGKVRGLLCNLCNRSIGGLGDSIELLKKAINYLETNDGAYYNTRLSSKS